MAAKENEGEEAVRGEGTCKERGGVEDRGRGGGREG